jgi:hypothetical protein
LEVFRQFQSDLRGTITNVSLLVAIEAYPLTPHPLAIEKYLLAFEPAATQIGARGGAEKRQLKTYTVFYFIQYVSSTKIIFRYYTTTDDRPNDILRQTISVLLA